MSKKLFYLLGIAVTIIVGTVLYLYFCCNCCVSTKKVDTSQTTVEAIEKTRNPFVLSGSGINYQCNDNFNFLNNNPSLITPVSDSIKLGIEKLKAILIANPDQKISITGYAEADEVNTSNFENLGLARANDIKNFLISLGLPSSQFDVKGELADQWEMRNDTLLGPVSFKFNELKNTDQSSFKSQINANPLILHFDSNQANYNLNTEERQKIENIVKYTIETPDATVLIVGHSDSSGNPQANNILAKKRAEFTKNYLVKNGIKSSRIETQSKGSDEPVAENETPEGMAKNRRTIITIK